jgi:excinuclease ABC subunit C
VAGGMVVFENARPLKSAYKKFNIKTIEGVDDYGSMREVLQRRLSRYHEEKESGAGFGRLPDLILLDGGKGHVSAIEPLIREMGFDIPVFGMVKDSSHRTRAIAQNGGEIAIAASKSAFSLVSKIQEEVHRFAITHMKKKHQKNSFVLRLTGAPGIGEKRAAALLKHFKTAKALQNAAVEELAAAPGMTKPAARAVYDFLRD